MAIKTKKITDLGTINVTSGSGAGSLSDSDFYLIGCKSGITGKVETNAFLNAIQQSVNDVVGQVIPSALTSVIDDTDVKQTKIDIINISNNLNDLNSLVQSLESELIKIKEKSAKYEQFIQTLQKDGYLTLAEIKKAAADACPICNHTHEEEITTEA